MSNGRDSMPLYRYLTPNSEFVKLSPGLIELMACTVRQHADNWKVSGSEVVSTESMGKRNPRKLTQVLATKVRLP